MLMSNDILYILLPADDSSERIDMFYRFNRQGFRSLFPNQ